MRRLALLTVLLVLPGSAHAMRLPGAPRCPIFPKTNPWNMRVDTWPVKTNSDAMIQSIGADVGLHADFGSGLYDGAPIGIPYTVVGRSQPKSYVSFDQYRDESDDGPYPIPKNVPIEGGRQSAGDRHALIIDRDNCRLYELYALYPTPDGWQAGSGAIWNLRSNKLRPAGWTSADAAGLPIFPGLARYDEVARGGINHALRFTVARTQRAYAWPARHWASNLTDRNLPPMGTRVRLKWSFDVSGFPKQARVILVALKRYGMMLADNGSNWYISGAPNPHWSNAALQTLSRVKGSDFEVVETGPITGP